MNTLTATDVRPIALTWAPKEESHALIAASVPLARILEAQRDYLCSYFYVSHANPVMELCGPMKDTLRYMSFRHRNKGATPTPPELSGLLIPGRCWQEISGGLLIRVGPRGSRHGQFALLTSKIPEGGKTLTLIDKP